MSTTSETLTLADQLEDTERPRLHLLPYVATKLRHLHEENERLAVEVANRNRRALDGDMAVIALENTHAYYEGLEARCDQLLKAFRKMKNVAAAYSNYCDDTGATRKLEREFDEADAIVRNIIKAGGQDV